MSVNNVYKLIIGMLLSCVGLTSCTNDNLYIDLQKQSIVSCTGKGFKKIRISSDSSIVIMEYTGPIIFFNKKNNISRTSLNGSLVYNYTFKLRSNSDYEIIKENGSDQGPEIITFKTNNIGKVVEASDTQCP